MQKIGRQAMRRERKRQRTERAQAWAKALLDAVYVRHPNGQVDVYVKSPNPIRYIDVTINIQTGEVVKNARP